MRAFPSQGSVPCRENFQSPGFSLDSGLAPSLVAPLSVFDDPTLVLKAGDVGYGWKFSGEGPVTYSVTLCSFAFWFNLLENFITLDEFRRWNPSITADCGGLVVGKSYCVEVLNEPAASTSSSSFSSSAQPTSTSSSAPVVTTPSSTLVTSPSTTAPPTTAPPTNEVETPSPLQPEIAPNCDAFYFVQQGDNCETIAKANGISAAQFLAWNPKAGSDCTGLWANAYACVSIIGHTPTSAAPSTTTPGNGITTPSPIQSGIVSNSDSFYMVKSGDNCDKIASANGIISAQIISWNPDVGLTYGNLWLDTYVCISIIGHTPTTTTKAPATSTRPGNGVTTPTPYQEGMKTSCKTFHYIVSGDNCSTLATKYKISTTNFVKWNPAVGSTCGNLWLSTYACVAVL
ncbi:carbohydrate-binding module family 50 protein [Karstenula rhodostoma CBS 690.94]|uniref:Carbohydrate-binding module family 50 protein n=1 Tax=Karstenula rhodostoma CBS 690.94 TaxID=1392251 RepID=A0A9P4PL77_9PLEO|nr:carbohydrate-binding module family 50 protein [Karstenula rhodostoma CBS 690.94]